MKYEDWLHHEKIRLGEAPAKVEKVNYTVDPVVNTVIHRMVTRSAVGMEKYGTTMERTDIDTVGWIDHTIEELIDAACYLERLKRDLTKKTP
tara:strand:- start:112 stop:387 length:276 start_codon:yes stop_codon:yes gene_type:complete